MRRLVGWFAIACSVAACGSVKNPDSCKVACTTDTECPAQQTCGELGRCSSGEECPCEAGAFLGCVEADTAALFCGTGGAGVAVEDCAGGCNSAASRCNTCVPSTTSCSADATSVQACAEDGVTASDETCALTCAEGGTAPHCRNISPIYMPDVCDVAAVESEFVVPTGGNITLDTGLATSCTGGILAPTVGAEICVVRARRIKVEGTLKVVGVRALALIADDELSVTGYVNASATGFVRGPGVSLTSGGAQTGSSGGGGAGFRQVGGAGGNTTTGGGSAGGIVSDVAAETWGLKGGLSARSGSTNAGYAYPVGGGGGGAATLVACRGTVDITGVVAANGGGGSAGVFLINSMIAGMIAAGGTGGGSGGLIVIQGAAVKIDGRLYANGGGGGGGCDVQGCTPSPGMDGGTSTTPAGGGTGAAGGNGGTGGTFNLPGAGLAGKGGGGGSAGFIKIYVPDASALTVTSTDFSPPYEVGSVLVR